MCEESCEAGELRDTLSDEAVLDGGHKSRQGSETFRWQCRNVSSAMGKDLGRDSTSQVERAETRRALERRRRKFAVRDSQLGLFS